MTTPDSGPDWHEHIIEDAAGVARVIEATRRIAVIGIKTDAGQPAYYVPEYAIKAGFDVVPVPVYYPDITTILGRPVFRTVASIPGNVDMVNVFRRSRDVAQHVQDIINKAPKSVWMQLGIRDDSAAEELARAGIDVVQDRCLMVELRRHGK